MSLEAWGDCDGWPEGYVTDSRAAEMVVKKMQEIADALRSMAGGQDAVPDKLRHVPFSAMVAIADWIDPPNAQLQPHAGNGEEST